jgi:hypothetical protein
MRRSTTPTLLVLAFVATLGGCADIYYDRRDAVAFRTGDAIEANKVAHIIDPWPRASADRGFESEGQRMQRAIARYRTNKTTPLATTATSSVPYAQQQGESTPSTP